MTATYQDGTPVRRHDRVTVFVGERERTPWRTGRIVTVGPTPASPPPLSLPGLPDGTVRVLTDRDPVDDFPGFTITHNTLDPELAGLLRLEEEP